MKQYLDIGVTSLTIHEHSITKQYLDTPKPFQTIHEPIPVLNSTLIPLNHSKPFMNLFQY